jgi:hypothetical protein
MEKMVIAALNPVKSLNKCPHCGSGFVTWDKLDKEPFCYNCGWRKALRITAEQARNHFRTEREFWLNLFSVETDPDDPSESNYDDWT